MKMYDLYKRRLCFNIDKKAALLNSVMRGDF